MKNFWRIIFVLIFINTTVFSNLKTVLELDFQKIHLVDSQENKQEKIQDIFAIDEEPKTFFFINTFHTFNIEKIAPLFTEVHILFHSNKHKIHLPPPENC